MTSKILSLTFDPATFPISPNYESFSVREKDDVIEFEALEPSGDTSSFTVDFQSDQKGYLKDGLDEDCRLVANILKGQGEFKITFSKLGDHPKQRPIAVLDSYDYLKGYFHAFTKASLFFITASEQQEYEKSFSMDYLKKTFSNSIEGNDAFWEKFHSELDMATAPLNVEISRAMDGHPPKPIIFKNEPAPNP